MDLRAEVHDSDTITENILQFDEKKSVAVHAQTPHSFKARSSLYIQWCKPAFDRICAITALLVLAIPMVAIGGLVRQSMGSPVLFRQRRVGLDGRIFEVLKFRSMATCRRQSAQTVNVDNRVNHKCDKDPRHTKVGRFLRRFSLDELPQLINVARGEMSLVGPRPELESVVERFYTDELHQRHLVKPGLTGLWQISARGEGPMHENGEWDIEYVRSVSPLTDLRILLKTPLVIFGDRAGQ